MPPPSPSPSPRHRPRGVGAATLSLALLASLMSACTVRVGGDGRSLTQHNDELRTTNRDLRRQVQTTEQQIARLQQELQTYRLGAQQPPGDAPPMRGWWSMTRLLGRMWRLPSEPAARSQAPMEAATPRQ